MAILITGGTGKTSIRLARLLQKANVPFVLASRSANKKAPDGMQSVVFDWTDNSTYSNPFRHKFANGEKVTAVYLIAPEVLDPVPPMNAFLDYAVKEHGVKKFTLMSGSTLTKGGPYTGMVWQHLADLNTEYTILKCTWLDENFSEGYFTRDIIAESQFSTAADDGLAPFVSAWDIANVALHTLTDDKQHEEVYRVLGPELLTYDQVAEKFTKALGRPIKHNKVTGEQVVGVYMKLGMPQETAGFMSYLETLTASNGPGSEKRMNDVVYRITGKRPKSIDEFIQENIKVWQ